MFSQNLGTLPDTDLAVLTHRLAQLEARESVQRTLTRYFELCDVPATTNDLDAIAELFTEDAVWEGVGSAYSGRFGQHQGRTAIVSKLAQYLPPSPHFISNVHVLGAGQMTVTDGAATGQWIMQQLSKYDGGTVEILAARLTVDFALTATGATISHFRTEHLFSADLTTQLP